MLSVCSVFLNCSNRDAAPAEERIRVNVSEDALGDTSSVNTVRGGLALSDISTYPARVVLTGMPDHRLVTVYRSPSESQRQRAKSSYRYYYDEDDGTAEHFMPGIDLLYGYNLVNIAHYDLRLEQLNFMFPGPVLVKSLYYPSFVQDSVDMKPINREYYLVSVYDADTNGDTLITKKDLRRFYHFDASSRNKTQLIPLNYSVIRSQYDPKNDVMFIYARRDENADGMISQSEPLHIFWMDLKTPTPAKRLY